MSIISGYDSNRRNSMEVRAPGRINLIGEHTDYNDGYVLPAAIDRCTTVSLIKNNTESTCSITALDLDDFFSFQLDSLVSQTNNWRNYCLGVIDELQKGGALIRGFNAKISGNVPIGSGMSSSAALECSFAFALNELFHLGFDRLQLIRICQMAEHNFVGTKCGIMDQFASMMGKKDHVILLDCRTLQYQYFPLQLQGYQIVLLNSNVPHSLAKSEYNKRREECEEGVSVLAKHIEGITHLRDVSLVQLLQFRSHISDTIFRRCHHVITENLRVLEAARALKTGRIHDLGKLLYQSHASLQKDYEVSCEELDFLVGQTKDKKYVPGARMMGGGFGGCTINIVKKEKQTEFVNCVSEAYFQQFNLNLIAYSVSPEDGAKQIKEKVTQ